MRSSTALICPLIFLLHIGCSAATPHMQRIAINPNQSGFIQTPSNHPFHPWGLNYDRDYKMRLLEDYWQSEWPTVVADFAEMKRLGAKVVRIHLQFAKFITSPDQPNTAALAQLTRLLQLADSTGFYLDITGFACYRRADVPDWYADLDEPHRWAAQAKFWEAIATTCADHPAVFCYGLVNEPSPPHRTAQAQRLARRRSWRVHLLPVHHARPRRPRSPATCRAMGKTDDHSHSKT